MKKFVSWRRVSTQKQGQSGLGLEAQKSIVDYFVQSENGELVADYVETHTGKDLEGCVELRKAMARAKKEGAVLVIAKTDRFRNTVEALQVYDTMGEGNIMFCDLPHTDKFTLTIFFALAEREALLVSIRTKAALKEAKNRGTRLGNSKGIDLTAAQKASAEARKERARADKNNRILWGILKDCQGKYTEYAVKLNSMGMRTASGLEFDYDRVKSTYHNLKRLYEAA